MLHFSVKLSLPLKLLRQLPSSPERVCRHCPVTMSHTLTVESALPETRMLFRSSMPDVRDWCPIRVCLQAPVSTSHTRMLVSREPLTTWTPSNCRTCKTQTIFYSNPFTLAIVHSGVATVEESHYSTFLSEHLPFHLCSVLTYEQGQVQQRGHTPQYPEPQSHCTSAA